jgi:PAS domain S-box-containing protein
MKATEPPGDPGLGIAHNVLHALADGVIVCDRDWRVVYANPAGLALMPFHPEPVIGRLLWDFDSSLRTGTFAEHCRTAARTRAPITFEHQWERSGGCLEVRLLPLADRMSMLLRDITAERRMRTQLENAYHLYENAASMSSLGAWQFEPAAGVVWWSEQIRVLYGLPADAEASYEAYAALVHPEDRDDTLRQLQCATDAGVTIDLRHRIVRANDAAVRWVRQVGRVQPREDGRLYYVGAAQDVTEDVEKARELARALGRALEAEQRLEAELAFSRATTHALTEGICVVDTELRVVYMNPAAERMLGVRLDGCEGSVLLDRNGVDPATRRPFDRPGQVALGSTIPLVNDDGTLQRADGKALQVAYVATALRGDLGLIGAVVVFRDTSADRRARQLALELDHLFQLSDELFVVARNGELLRANPAAERTLRLQASGERRWTELMHDADVATARAWYARLEQGLTVPVTVLRIDDAAGQARWIEWNGARDADSTIFIVGRDVSARVLATEDLRRANQELAVRNEALEDFAIVASHDLQEPLRKICTFGSRLADRFEPSADAVGKDYLNRMIDAAERMRNLIDGLLTYSRAAQPMRAVAVDLDQLTREVLLDLEVEIARTHAQLQVGPLPIVQGNPTQYRQVMQNLIGNALKFVAPGQAPQVWVSARTSPAATDRTAQRCHIIIEDAGIGFDPRFADRIFEPFERLHPRDHYEGSGIGLAVVRRIVQRQGGRISASPRPGGGAVFEFDLPVATSASVPLR